MELILEGTELTLGDYGIEQAYLLLLIIPAVLVFYYLLKKEGMNRKKWVFLFTRFLITSLIVLSLTSPFIANRTTEITDTTSIIILSDQSGSMSMTDVDKNLAEKISEEVSSAVGNLTGNPGSVELRYFSKGNRTEVGNALYQETLRESKEKSLIVLLSDGNSNHGRDAIDMAQILANANITVFTVVPEFIQKDMYIAGMTGDKKTPANADYALKIDVGKAGCEIAKYNLNLKVDGNIIYGVNEVIQTKDTRSFHVMFSMDDVGVHKITAEIKPLSEDYIKVNNEMIKSVDVVAKPDVLLVSESPSSPLAALLNVNYDVTRTNSPRQDYSKYDVVYFDNIPGEKIDQWVVNSLHEYIVDGNGLVVVGGENSYEKGNYHNNPIETLLPVIST